MAGITLADAEAQLAAWLAASTAIAGGQEYEIDTGSGGRRRLRRADLAQVQSQITYWDGQVKRLSASGRARTRYIVPTE